MTIAKDGDRMDNTTPVNAGGVSIEKLGELQAAVAAVGASVADLEKAISIADHAVDQAASWAAVAIKVVDLIEQFVPLLSKHANATGDAVNNTTGDVRRLVFNGLLAAWQAPKDQRGGILTGVMQGLLGAAAK